MLSGNQMEWHISSPIGVGDGTFGIVSSGTNRYEVTFSMIILLQRSASTVALAFTVALSETSTTTPSSGRHSSGVPGKQISSQSVGHQRESKCYNNYSFATLQKKKTVIVTDLVVSTVARI